MNILGINKKELPEHLKGRAFFQRQARVKIIDSAVLLQNIHKVNLSFV